MAVTLDLMEYANDGAAQVAYVTSDVLGLQSYSEGTIKTQGSYSLKGVATIIAGLNDTLTRIVNSEYVDQSEVEAIDEWHRLGDSGGVEYRVGQSFKLSRLLTVTAVEVWRNTGTAGTPSGNWTLRIETDNSNKPSGTLADANASIVVTPPSEGATVKGTFATPFILSAATTYWIVINCDNQSNNVSWRIGIKTGGAYTDGISATSANGVWSAGASYDCWFKVYGKYTIDLSGQTQIKFDIRSNRTGANVRVSIHDSGGTTTSKDYSISSANAFETVTWDISAVADADKNAIDRIIVTILNADADNTFYIDNMYGTTPSGGGILTPRSFYWGDI